MARGNSIMAELLDPEGKRLPIKLDSTSNGEFMPQPVSRAVRVANALAHTGASALARRLGLSRRSFLASSCGAAATLLAMNRAYSQAGMEGGFFEVPAEAALEREVADAVLGGNEFIFDVQSHHVNPAGQWRSWLNPWNVALRFFPQADCADEDDAIACLSVEHYIKEIFLDSDTDIAVLSSVPYPREDNPLTIEEAAATRRTVEALEGSRRLLIHGLVHPQLPGAIDDMSRLKEEYAIAAWKTYAQWGPDGKGYWLHDERFGVPMIEEARKLEVPIICVHKGLPLPGILFEEDYASPADIGVVAKMFPDVTFIVYHSGYEPSVVEGPYDPEGQRQLGVNALVHSLVSNGVAPGSNVYAELGSTWRAVMQKPTEAAHLLGKLFKYVGEDRVLWGTDSIWYGSPQDQILAFRTFQIAEALREQYGYPEITAELRAKVFGLNAIVPYRISPDEVRRHIARDVVAPVKENYVEVADPSFHTYGPKTRREFLDLMKLTGGRPA